MPAADDILWFKQKFRKPIEAGTAGTIFDLDRLTAIACQETGYIWQVLRKKSLTQSQILALCVGDTLDSDKGRKAFPKTKYDLVNAPNGPEMFTIAHQALVEMAKFIPGYSGVAAKPNKFCHGYGVFQYDLQFFREDPGYFLEKRYARFDDTLARCLKELTAAAKRTGFGVKPTITDYEFACIAIAYNTGGFKPSLGLKQGYFNGTKYYGEQIFDFVRLARTIPTPGSASALTAAPPGSAAIAQPTPVSASGPTFVVDTQSSTLRVRSEPKISAPRTTNVVGELPDGHLVRAVTGTPVKTFLEIETSLSGAHIRGFAAMKFLKSAPRTAFPPVVSVAATLPTTGIVAVYMPRKPGTITKRTDPTGAHSLNEANQPSRTGATPDELRAEFAGIIRWLAVDKLSHKRYQSRDGLTFCNVYAHDYCHLAGVYLPRVWWTPKAIETLAQGKPIEPLYGDTIDEVRANSLFRWLRDFGPRFGWRQTGALDKLQLEANQGAIGLIVARRKEDGRSGHIVTVVPETDDQRARRDANGAVIAPLQSQAGSRNFQYGTGQVNWWKGEQFAESGFWIHA